MLSCDRQDLTDLRENFVDQQSIAPENDFIPMDSASGKLNYIKTLYACWKLKGNNPYINVQNSDPQSFSLDWYSISRMLNGFATTGDHQNVLNYTPVIPVEIDQKISPPFQAAQTFIATRIKDQRVVMFNEAHDRIQCRAFFLQMLPQFRAAGFTHLALESLNNKTLPGTDNDFGSFVYEPVYAQILQKAKHLGFTMVAYEDTTRITTGDEREKWQAVNLYQKIKDGTTFYKTLVLAGYQHISEDSTADYKNMAYYFKQISKENPLTIDQTV